MKRILSLFLAFIIVYTATNISYADKPSIKVSLEKTSEKEYPFGVTYSYDLDLEDWNRVDLSEQCDIVLVQSSKDKEKYEKEGYFLPLDDYPEIMEKIDDMYPYVKDAIIREGKLLYIPYRVYTYGALGINNFAVDMKMWKKLGYDESDLPSTYSEFIDILDKISSEKSEYLKENRITLYFGRMTLSQELKLMILNDLLTAKSKGREVTFNSKKIKGLIEKINNSSYISKTKHYNMAEELENAEEALFRKAEDMLKGPSGAKRLLLTVEKGDDPYIYADCDLIAINAKTKFKKECITFVKDIMDGYGKRLKASLYKNYDSTSEIEKTYEYLKEHPDDGAYEAAKFIDEISYFKQIIAANAFSYDKKYLEKLRTLNMAYEEQNRFYKYLGVDDESVREFKNNAEKIYISNSNNYYLSADNLYDDDDAMKFFAIDGYSPKLLDNLQKTYGKK